MTRDDLNHALAPLIDEIALLRRAVWDLQDRVGHRLLSQREAASRRGVSPRTIRQWEAEGRLTRVKTSGHPRYLIEDVDAA